MSTANKGIIYGVNKKALSPYQELCKFADDFSFTVELEKPFKELPQLFLKIMDQKDEVAKITIENIDSLEEVSARVLNDLSKTKNND